MRGQQTALRAVVVVEGLWQVRLGCRPVRAPVLAAVVVLVVVVGEVVVPALAVEALAVVGIAVVAVAGMQVVVGTVVAE